MDRLAENLKEELTIRIGQKDGLARVPAAGDVVERAFVLEPEWTSHDGRVAPGTSRSKI